MAEEKKLFPRFTLYAPPDLRKQWFVYWYEHGRRIRKYGTINQHDTAEDRRAAAIRLIAGLKKSFRPKDHPVEERVRAWLDAKRHEWKPKSVATYRSVADEFFLWMGLREVAEEHVEAFFAQLLGRVSNTTYNKYREKLKQMLEAVGERGLFENIERVKEVRTPARYFQRHQQRLLKKAISEREPELWLFIQFIYYCFIRPGELRHLVAGDILLDEQKIIVRASVSKNSKTQYVAIPDGFVGALDFVADLKPKAYIFPSVRDKSKPVGENTMAYRHRKILKSLGFPIEYKLYSWKHTGAVQAVLAGVSVKELQMQLRHHSLDQVNEYLRQMGVMEMGNLRASFPAL